MKSIGKVIMIAIIGMYMVLMLSAFLNGCSKTLKGEYSNYQNDPDAMSGVPRY